MTSPAQPLPLDYTQNRHFRRSADGTSLHYRIGRPATAPIGSAVIAHGLGDHRGRFATLAGALVADGYQVHALDQRGHGHSDGPRANTSTFDILLDDFADELRFARESASNKPVFVIAHSWGSLLALGHLARGGTGIDGLVLSAPAARQPTPPVTLAVATALGRLAPGIGTKQPPFDQAIRDPEVVAAFFADPLVFHGRIRARMAAEVLRTINTIAENLPTITTPLLALHGTADVIADKANSEFIHDTIGSLDRSLKLYEGLYHQLFNEPERRKIIQDTLAWLQVRT